MNCQYCGTPIHKCSSANEYHADDKTEYMKELNGSGCIHKPLNEYQYCTPLRVIDVYGHWLYVSKEDHDNPNRTQIHICRKDGLKRTYTKAGKDNMNTIHRDNIAGVKP